MEVPRRQAGRHGGDEGTNRVRRLPSEEGAEQEEDVEMFPAPGTGITLNDSSGYAPTTPLSWPRSFGRSMSDLVGSPSPVAHSSYMTPTRKFGRAFDSGRLRSSTHTSSVTSSENAEAVLEGLVVPLLSEQSRQTSDNEEFEKGQQRGDYNAWPPLDQDDNSNPETDISADSSQKSSAFRATLNGINILTGVGILSTPYATAQAGWLGLSILVIFAAICCFTGILLRDCLESQPGMFSYADIGEAAFGRIGRWLISFLLYIELYLVTVDFLILEGDNLSYIFPQTKISFGNVALTSNQTFVILTAIIVLPTVLLRNVSYLAFISAGGVLASILVVLGVAWVGVVNKVGFHHSGTLLQLEGVPTAVGIFGFCYSGHAVFPTIYMSMKDRKQFPFVLIISFVICTLMYAGVAAMGYAMYGETLESQITLNLPEEFMASRAAIWTTVVNPITKYGLTMTPLVLAFEELIPASAGKGAHLAAGTCIRTALVVSGTAIALAMPYFSYVMAFIGSFLSMSISVIIPCSCFLRIKEGKVSRYEAVACCTIICIGFVCAVVGTWASVWGIWEGLES